MADTPPFFTILTPTYNRAGTLHRVYESLCQQTFKDFEWVVVDDGSTDNTHASVLAWQRARRFPSAMSGKTTSTRKRRSTAACARRAAS